MDRQAIEKTAGHLRPLMPTPPEIGLILGSGLGVLADEIEEAVRIPYEDIPGFPVSTVEGHAGRLVYGRLEGATVVAMQGRFHYYEGYSLQEVTFPVRVMKALGVRELIVTNAAGGINERFQPGDFMIISDHINLLGTNPLIGPNDPELGPRFPDMTEAYSRRLRELAKETAARLGVRVHEGVYVANTGPSYETPAEIRMIRTLGGDAVGMSTVPEVIVARHGGIEVLGISCISNMAAGMSDAPLHHDEVVETAERVKTDFLRFVKAIVAEMAKSKRKR
ncbi:purine-nucleoside phosphorylase [Geobacillus sp. G4]|uniref:Purine nucleoside phosphorylase n=8 Tax=Geobacillus TaxID=129337 RepID=Q5KXI8_GEOKA|nr:MULTISPECIES: purine-nucleoside phosphorylase [Geobacillus]KDE46867.1 purine nucleoside phosphorylase [Geobacillus sp. CAMR12739]ADI26217.1 purine nucleoside phosphorylase I, inosine and guanosine-specific [Geobacillus sp. C56-T3]AEV19913.1 Purine nucleoside phosphorylase 1 [Geobacillus thermoleovorans CCB_US3_UF5]AGE22911.1 purine nucleoside phosphorylase 1 [Geobacillus sp. GHH01]AMV11453.1 purine-nucleoside phosphorylase [Geobacillus thermoleovorans]